MNKKMKRYEEGGEVEFETAQGPNKNIGDDVRARAMAAMAARDSGAEEAEPAKPKAAPKAAPKAEPKKAESKPYVEKSGFQQKKEKALEGVTVKPTPKTESKPAPAAKARSEKTAFEMKKERALGMKAGGSVSSASKRADGCAIKGKTKGRMV